MIDELMPLVDCDDCDLQDEDCFGTDCKDAQRLSDLRFFRIEMAECRKPSDFWHLEDKLDQLIKEATNGG